MSFGLTNASAYFLNLMNKIFIEYSDRFVVVFINDIFVYSKDTEKLREHQLYAEYNKSEFYLSDVSFMGHIISVSGVAVDLAKVEVVMDWKPPTTLIKVWSFLGLA